MKKILFKGCGTALSTPFIESRINFDEYKKMIDFQINEGVDSLIVCGTTGESATMTLAEKKSLIKFTVDVVHGRIPVIAGTGSNCTKSTIELSQYAEEIGVDGLLIVTPFYNKTTQKGLVEHYSIISKNTNLPIILYNVPSRTGLNILPQTCLELSKIENIVAIKEASGNISQIAEIASLCGENLNIYSGNDDQILPILSLGGLGVISVLSNIYPKYTHQLTKAFFDGNISTARKLQLKSIPLIKSLFSEVNPIPIKSALNYLGFNYGVPRLPLIEMSEKSRETLINEIKKFENNN